MSRSLIDHTGRRRNAANFFLGLGIVASPLVNFLSDDNLADRLKIDGVDIARRTVAKYREAMNIPSSIQRRRQKKRLATFT